ncbi:MAG: nucleotidyltransferase domain-containing protein [Armatimonadota bacterium]
MTTRELIHEERDEILTLAARHKAKHVRLFGSVARGEDTPESDVDFLVEFEPDADLDDHIDLMDALTALLGR